MECSPGLVCDLLSLPFVTYRAAVAARESQPTNRIAGVSMLTLILKLLRLGGSHVVSEMEGLTVDDAVDLVGDGMGLDSMRCL